MKHKNDKGEYFEKIQKSENNKNSDHSFTFLYDLLCNHSFWGFNFHD